jgi:CPA1 family monovalent cation:H+ antiporter
VLQGLTLPWVVRLLGVAEPDGPNLEEESARRHMLEAALGYLAESREKDQAEFDAVYEDLNGHYQQRLAVLATRKDAEAATRSKYHRRLAHIARDLLRVERETAVRLRDQGDINDEVLRQLERELDLREAGPTHVTQV